MTPFQHGELWGNGAGGQQALPLAFSGDDGDWVKIGISAGLLLGVTLAGTAPDAVDLQVDWSPDGITPYPLEGRAYDGAGVSLVSDGVYRFESTAAGRHTLRLSLSQHTVVRVKMRRVGGDGTSTAYVEGYARPPFDRAFDGGGGGWIRATATVAGQVIAGGTTWMLQVPLGKTGLNMGYARVYLPASILYSVKRRMGGTVSFTDSLNDAFSLMGQYKHFSVPISGVTYYTTIREQHGYLYSNDHYLSAAQYHSNGHPIRIDSAVIVGVNLEIVFRNTGSLNGTLDVEVEVRATKI